MCVCVGVQYCVVHSQSRCLLFNTQPLCAQTVIAISPVCSQTIRVSGAYTSFWKQVKYVLEFACFNHPDALQTYFLHPVCVFCHQFSKSPFLLIYLLFSCELYNMYCSSLIFTDTHTSPRPSIVLQCSHIHENNGALHTLVS